MIYPKINIGVNLKEIGNRIYRQRFSQLKYVTNLKMHNMNKFTPQFHEANY